MFPGGELPLGIRSHPQNQSDPAKLSLGVHRTTILALPSAKQAIKHSSTARQVSSVQYKTQTTMTTVSTRGICFMLEQH